MAAPTRVRRRARFHELEVAEVRPLTADAIEVTLRRARPSCTTTTTTCRASTSRCGTSIDGHELRRSYSICRPPDPRASGRSGSRIKRDLGGRFSTWATSELRSRATGST